MSNHSELKTINFIPVCVFLHTFYDKNQHMYTYLWLNENVLSKKSNTVKQGQIAKFCLPLWNTMDDYSPIGQ